MKTLLLSVLLIFGVSARVFGSEGSGRQEPELRCHSTATGKGVGLFVQVFDKGNHHSAVLGEYWVSGHEVLATFRVSQSRGPGGDALQKITLTRISNLS